MKSQKGLAQRIFLDQDCDQTDKEFEILLGDDENQKFLELLTKYREDRKSSNDYFFFIANILNFIKRNAKQDDVIIYAGAGMIPSQYKKVKFLNSKGIVVGFDSRQIEKLLQKSRSSFSNTFLTKYANELSIENLYLIFSKNKELVNKMVFTSEFLLKLQRNFIFYFIEFSHFLKNGISVSNEKFTFSNQPLKSNVSYLLDYQSNESNEKSIADQKRKAENLSKKRQNFMKHLQDVNDRAHFLISKNRSLFSQTNEVENDDDVEEDDYSGEDDDYGGEDDEYSGEENDDDVEEEDEDDMYDRAEKQLDSIEEVISQLEIQKQNPLILHKKGQIWQDDKILKFGFLIKYCSSSAYRRLFVLLGEKIPPPSTIESHFRIDIKNREIILTNPNQITEILDKYWENNYDTILNYLKEFNSYFDKNENIDDFKINVCVGCDAASLTSFLSKKRSNKSKRKKHDITSKVSKEKVDSKSKLKQKKEQIKKTRKKINEIKKMINARKKALFNSLVNGTFEAQFIQIRNQNLLAENDSPNFITYLLQPLIWHLPIIVIKLSKSESGSIKLNDANDINIIFKIINSHKHFTAKYFAADGTKSLDELHRSAFDKYKSLIPDLISNKITIDQFIQKVEQIIFVFPILDMLHSEKTGRDKISDHQIKLGENVEIINKENIENNLDLPFEVLNDKTDIGRMNDHYAINLFTFENTEKLYSKKLYASGLYFFVYSIILEIFRNPFIHIISRSEISKLVLYLLILIYNGINKLPSNTSIQKSSKKYVWFGTYDTIISLINTMLAICIGFKSFKTYFCLGMERYSSHPDEQFFGRYRDKFIGFNTLQNAFRYAVRASLALDFENDLNVNFTIPKRENFGGVHLNFKGSNGKIFDIYPIFQNDFVLDIRDFAFDLYKTGTGKRQKLKEVSIFTINQLYSFFNKFQSSKNHIISETKGISIVPRIIKASKHQHIKKSFFEEYDNDMKKLEKNSISSLYKGFGVEDEYRERSSDNESSENHFSSYDYDEDSNNGKKNRRHHAYGKRH